MRRERRDDGEREQVSAGDWQAASDALRNGFPRRRDSTARSGFNASADGFDATPISSKSAASANKQQL
jgi:hypothetical protein